MRKFCWSPHEIPLYKPTSIYDLLIHNISLLFSWRAFGKPLVEIWIGRFQVNDDGLGQPKAPTKRSFSSSWISWSTPYLFVLPKLEPEIYMILATTEKCQCNKKIQDWVVATQIFFIFTPTWGNDPIWRAYFPNGLVQPPIRRYVSIVGVP